MGIELIAGASAHCLSDLIIWSDFDVAPMDRIVMNVLVIEIEIEIEIEKRLRKYLAARLPVLVIQFIPV